MKWKLPQLEAKIGEQAERVRTLKAGGATKAQIAEGVENLLSLKQQLPKDHTSYPVTKVTPNERRAASLTRDRLQDAKKQKKKEGKLAVIASRPVHEQPHYVACENPCQWPQIPPYPRIVTKACTGFVHTAIRACELIQVIKCPRIPRV